MLYLLCSVLLFLLRINNNPLNHGTWTCVGRSSCIKLLLTPRGWPLNTDSTVPSSALTCLRSASLSLTWLVYFLLLIPGHRRTTSDTIKVPTKVTEWFASAIADERSAYINTGNSWILITSWMIGFSNGKTTSRTSAPRESSFTQVIPR